MPMAAHRSEFEHVTLVEATYRQHAAGRTQLLHDALADARLEVGDVHRWRAVYFVEHRTGHARTEVARGHRKTVLLLGERRLQDQVAQLWAGVDRRDELGAISSVARKHELAGTAVQAVG